VAQGLTLREYDDRKEEDGRMAHDLRDVRFLTVAEVADMMRVSRMTVYRLVHSGELPAIRFGRSFRVPESAVDQLLQAATFREGGVADSA
jgi:excisionase family DNA binding protein